MTEIDLSEFTEAVQPRKKRCGIAKAIDKVGADRATKLIAALAARNGSQFTYSHIAVSRVLKSWDFDLSPQIVARHRAKECPCASEAP